MKYFMEVASILQLEDHLLVDKVKSVLVEEAKQADTFQELFYIWSTSVTYELEVVVEVVLTIVEVKLEQFMTSPSDLS